MIVGIVNNTTNACTTKQDINLQKTNYTINPKSNLIGDTYVFSNNQKNISFKSKCENPVLVVKKALEALNNPKAKVSDLKASLNNLLEVIKNAHFRDGVNKDVITKIQENALKTLNNPGSNVFDLRTSLKQMFRLIVESQMNLKQMMGYYTLNEIYFYPNEDRIIKHLSSNNIERQQQVIKELLEDWMGAKDAHYPPGSVLYNFLFTKVVPIIKQSKNKELLTKTALRYTYDPATEIRLIDELLDEKTLKGNDVITEKLKEYSKSDDKEVKKLAKDVLAKVS